MASCWYLYDGLVNVADINYVYWSPLVEFLLTLLFFVVSFSIRLIRRSLSGIKSHFTHVLNSVKSNLFSYVACHNMTQSKLHVNAFVLLPSSSIVYRNTLATRSPFCLQWIYCWISWRSACFRLKLIDPRLVSKAFVSKNDIKWETFVKYH